MLIKTHSNLSPEPTHTTANKVRLLQLLHMEICICISFPIPFFQCRINWNHTRPHQSTDGIVRSGSRKWSWHCKYTCMDKLSYGPTFTAFIPGAGIYRIRTGPASSVVPVLLNCGLWVGGCVCVCTGVLLGNFYLKWCGWLLPIKIYLCRFG